MARLLSFYVLGVAFVAFMGMAINSPKWVLLTATFFIGVCVSGGQKSAIALAAIFYPPALRSTGVGWALGLGRLGGIAGPLVIGALLGAGVGPSSIFYFAAVLPMLRLCIADCLPGAGCEAGRSATRKDVNGPSWEPKVRFPYRAHDAAIGTCG